MRKFPKKIKNGADVVLSIPKDDGCEQKPDETVGYPTVNRPDEKAGANVQFYLLRSLWLILQVFMEAMITGYNGPLVLDLCSMKQSKEIRRFVCENKLIGQWTIMEMACVTRKKKKSFLKPGFPGLFFETSNYP